MAKNAGVNQTKEKPYINTEDDESLWTSPVRATPAKNSKTVAGQTLSSNIQSRASQENASANQLYEETLKQELASVRRVNEAIEGVLESLEKAKNNMKSVNRTVSSASSLLDIWTRILSQTEHNQRLILDPSWQGASQDITDIEEEIIAKRQAAEKRELEEQELHASTVRRAEEEEKQRTQAASAKPKPPVRGKLGAGRGVSASRTTGAGGPVIPSTNSTARGTTSRRASGGLGRGTRLGRGRG